MLVRAGGTPQIGRARTQKRAAAAFCWLPASGARSGALRGLEEAACQPSGGRARLAGGFGSRALAVGFGRYASAVPVRPCRGSDGRPGERCSGAGCDALDGEPRAGDDPRHAIKMMDEAGVAGVGDLDPGAFER